LRWSDRQGSYEDYVNQVVATHTKYLRGSSEKQVVRAARQVVSEQKNRVYVYTRDLIKKIRRDYFLIAISGSSVEIVEEFARVYKFDFFRGTEMEIKNGIYTGKVLNCPADDKKKIVKDFLKEGGLGLKGSMGIGDTESDISFLEMVEKPICFNPNGKLYKEARQRKWPIVVERKDVIYKLDKTGKIV